MLIWCLKQFKDFILKFSISGSFFSNLYSMIQSFLLGGCVDKVVENRTNDQRYKNVYFLQYNTLIAIHSMSAEDW